MSIRHIFSSVALVAIAMGGGLASAATGEARPFVPVELATMPALDTELPAIGVAGHSLVEAQYWHRHHWHRHHWHSGYYGPRHYGWHRGWHRGWRDRDW
jgi:hypothetical protein